MSAADSKRYYWLKLKEDFFEDDTISWIEEQEHGKEYLVFYLKLCLKFMNKNGVFVREVGEKKMPYDIKRLAQITNTDIDTAMVAMKIFLETGLIMESEDGSFEVSNISEMIGSETNAAERMRLKRANNVRQVFAKCTPKCSPEIEKEIEIDKEIDIDNNIEAEAAADTIKHDFEIRELSRSNQLDISVFTYYERNIAPLMPIIAEKLKALIDEVGEIKVKSAIQEAATHNARSYAYIEAVARGNGKPKQEEETYEEKNEKNIG